MPVEDYKQKKRSLCCFTISDKPYPKFPELTIPFFEIFLLIWVIHIFCFSAVSASSNISLACILES